MGFKALVYAYILGGLTFIPLVIIALISFTIYTSVLVGDADFTKYSKHRTEEDSEKKLHEESNEDSSLLPPREVNDIPRTRRGWLTMRRTFEESSFDGSYVTLVRSFLDARSKDPKRSRPKDMWYVVLKGKVLYLYEDEGMTECEAVLELGGHEVVIFPEGQPDGELFAKRNAICLKQKVVDDEPMPSVSGEMKLESDVDVESKTEKEKEKTVAEEKRRQVAGDTALNLRLPWFIFVRTNVEMEDWYLSLVHASDHPANTPTLGPLQAVFQPSDMNHLVSTLDEQPDVIPMRWLNALIGRLFFSFYKTQTMETLIISRLMKKLSKVKRPAFLTDIVVTEVSVGNAAPTFSKPMLKELTKEGEASLEVHLQYKGEVRITVEATATINLGTRFKSYTVKLVLAAVLREIEGNLLIKVKRPPSNRIWYAFTASPKIVLDVEPIVSDRQITWTMILSTIEARLKEIIQESVVMPNMDDITFFNSDQYDHRGGIWADAVRHERTNAGVPDPHSLEKNSPVLSASVPDIAEPTVDSSSDPDAAHERSPSAEITPPTGPPLESNVVTLPHSVTCDETMTSSSASSSSASTGVTSTTGRSRRRTWFSSAGSADLGILKDVEPMVGADTPRGRAADLDTTIAAPRSKSTPNSPETLRAEKPGESQEHLTPDRLPMLPPRRSPSPSSVSSVEEDVQGQTLSRTASATSSRTKHTSPNSASTFLTTLRTRAAATDKQALQNQAKEAMRKWGVNWGGLRRDGNGGSGTSVSDDVPDAGPSEARIRVDSNNSSKRSSYAEVRAAVAERKGQNRNSANEGNEPSVPVAIPEGGRIKVRSVSASPGGVQVHPPSPSFSAVSISPPAQLPRQVSNSPESGSMSKGIAAAPAMSRSSNNSHSNDLFLNDRDIPEGEDKRTAPAPVRTQPPMAKSMTIPGIHASHRGEVMSMGYVAPPPPPPASTDNKLKAPAIQSVYRLWKSPTLSGRSLEETNSQTQTPDAQEHNTDVVPLTLSHEESPQSLPVKPQPPPLPPRPQTPNTTQYRTDTPQSPASEALKYIASRDGRRNSQNLTDTITTSTLTPVSTHDDVVENLSPLPSTPVPAAPPTKPPLPPRRISTSA